MIEIVVALRGEDMEWARGLMQQQHLTKPVRFVEGGDSRQQSVENALAALKPDTDLVAVHDAVRPFIDPELVEKVIAEAAETGAAIVGIVPVDTVKRVHKNKVRDTLPRENLVLAQTPQVFRFDLLKRAFERARARRFHRHRRIQPGGAPGRSGSERGAGQRPQHQDHAADRYGSRAPVPHRRDGAAERIVTAWRVPHRPGLGRPSHCAGAAADSRRR